MPEKRINERRWAYQKRERLELVYNEDAAERSSIAFPVRVLDEATYDAMVELIERLVVANHMTQHAGTKGEFFGTCRVGFCGEFAAMLPERLAALQAAGERG